MTAKDSESSKPKRAKGVVLPPVNATPDQIAKKLFVFAQKKAKKRRTAGKGRSK